MTETAEFPLVAPPPLKKGDTFGIIAPSGPWKDDEFRRGIEILENRGFKVRVPDPLPVHRSYLAGSDEQRLETLRQAWRDPGIRAVMPVRGGYGVLRLLNSIDYKAIRANPKVLVGFSDVSALLQAVYRYGNLLTFHGPMLTTLGKCDPASLEFLFDRLTGKTDSLKPDRLKILKGGSSSGIIVGGNLTTLTHLVATGYEISWQGKIVFLEDVGESPYRIDRLFTHLYMAGRFRDLRGLILGEFTGCGDQEEIWSRVGELFRNEEFPIWADFPVGHGLRNYTLPVGVQAKMDSAEKKLSFNFPAPS